MTTPIDWVPCPGPETGPHHRVTTRVVPGITLFLLSLNEDMGMANLGKKYTCFQCAAKFYDFDKPEALCPKCGANQKAAPSKPKAVKKEKSVHVIEDDFTP